MQILKAIIVDDELHGRNNLHSLLKSYCPEIEVIGKSGKPNEAKLMIYDLKPDVLFLDINMPQISGFDLLDSINEKNFLTVIVTAHTEYGIQAVKADVVDYLLKPIDINELQQTVKKLLLLNDNNHKENHVSNNKGKILVSHNDGSSLIDFSEVIRFEGQNNNTIINLFNKKSLVVSKTLKEFETTIPEDIFFRIHKSDIINLNFVKGYTNHGGGCVSMKDGSKIAISRRRLQHFEEVIKEYSFSLHNK